MISSKCGNLVLKIGHTIENKMVNSYDHNNTQQYSTTLWEPHQQVRCLRFLCASIFLHALRFSVDECDLNTCVLDL
jgi:hypothetical protein